VAIRQPLLPLAELPARIIHQCPATAMPYDKVLAGIEATVRDCPRRTELHRTGLEAVHRLEVRG